MPETPEERMARLMGGGAAKVAESPEARMARLMGGPTRATPKVAAGVRAAIYGDVADESVTPADEADKIALLDRVGTRRMATTRDFPIEAFGTTRGPQEMASKQAEFDVPAVADLERQAGPIKTKADVRRIGDAADMARAEAQYRVEHPTHPKMPDQYRDPAESRRFLSEAPGRRESRAEYEASGTRSPFLALAGSRMAKAASFGFVNPEDPESVISTPQERKILAGQDEFATPMERLGVGVATTAGMLLPVARIGGMFASGFRAAGASEAVASTVGNLLAGSVHGGVTERSAEAAVESGLYMGGQMGLARVMRGAAPTAGRFLAAEGGAGLTASAIAQLAANGVADPVQVIADGLTNALFGVGQARAAGRARTEAMARVKAKVAAELQAGKELRVVMAQMRDDADVQAMLRTPDEGVTGDTDAMLAELPPDDPMTIGRKERERVKGMLEPVEAPLAQPTGPRVPPDESMVAFIGRIHERGGVGKRGGSDMNRVLRERFGISEEHADHVLLRAATEGAIPRDVAEFQGVGLPKRNFRGRGPERVAAAEAGIVDDQGRPKWDLFSREAPPSPDVSPEAIASFPGDRITAPRTVEEALRASRSQSPVSVDPRATPEAPAVKGGYRWDGENFVVDRGTPEPVAIPKQPKPKKAGAPLPPRDAPLPGTEADRLLAEPATRDVAPATPDVAVRPTPTPEDPSPRPGKAGERGAVDVSGVGSAAARGVRTVLGTETQKIRDLGTPSAKEFADRLEQADDVRQERSGPLTPARRKVEVFASRPGGHGAARSLTMPDVVRSKVGDEPVIYALPRGEQIINGKAKARTPAEAKLVDLIEEYWQERGRGWVAVGTTRIDPKTGERVPFVPPKGVWPRVPHQEGLDIILAGKEDRAWRTLALAVADAQVPPIPVASAEKILTKMRDRMIGLSGVTGPETGRVSEAEVFRELENMPSDIWVRGPFGSRRISILETDPVIVVRRATDMGTSRMGVIKAFGQETGEGSVTDDLRRRFISENSGQGIDPTAVWDKAVRMAHAIPKNDPVITASHPIAPLVRGVKSALNLIKTMKMSNRWAPNLFEWAGAPREFAGLINQGKVQVQRFRDFVQTGKGREAVARDLERRGAIIDEGLALPADPSHPFSQATNIARQLIDTVSMGRPMESSQEHGFARGADLRLKQMQGRKGQGETHAGERDVLRLMQIGVEEAQARKLAYGDGTQAEYDTALRTAMNKGLGANTSQLSRSPLENSRIGKALWYNSWASMNLRHAGRTMLATIRGVESAFAPGLTPEARIKRLGASTRTFLSWAAGRAVTNATATAMMSIIAGGTTGLSANISAAKEDLAGYLLKSFAFGILGGPYAAMIRNMGDDLGRQIEGVATPVAVGRDLIHAITGDGRYEDKNGLDRVKEIVRTYIPFTKSLLAAKAAITGDTAKLHNDGAERAYFDWRRDSKLYKKSKDYDSEPSEFRAAVNKITELVEAGKVDDAAVEYDKARKIKAPKGMTLSKSIMDRRLLTISDMKRNAVGDTNPAEAMEMMKALRRHIGETAYAELEKRDAKLLEFLNSVGGK